MYVCLCHGLTEKQIKNALEESDNSLRNLQLKCGAGTDCGSCIRELREMLRNGQSEKKETQIEEFPEAANSKA